jgi:diguanylate cyclase (GGDEF)-like protein
VRRYDPNAFAQRFNRQVVLPLAAAVAVVLVGMLGLVLWTAAAQDRLAAEEQALLAAGAIAVKGENLASAAVNNVAWDEAYAALVTRPDLDWVDENLASPLAGSNGIAATLALAPAGSPFYAMVAGERADAEAAFAATEGLEPLIARWREGDPQRALHGLVLYRGDLAMAAIAAVRPYRNNIEAALLRPTLLVLIEAIGPERLADLARIYRLPDLRVEPGSGGAGPPAGVALTSAAGEPMERLVWTAARPGRDLLTRIVPGLAIVLSGLAILTWVVLRHATATARVIRESEARAVHDALTGLPNRTLLFDRLDRLMDGLHRRLQSAAVFYLDLDGFKAVNDRLGHEAGDALLRQVAERLRLAVRAEDTVARLGGDEFVIVAPGLADAAAIERKAEAVIAALERPFELNGRLTAQVGVSIGIARAPVDGLDGAELVRKADLALYEVKRSGKGRWQFFTEATTPANVAPSTRAPSEERQLGEPRLSPASA